VLKVSLFVKGKKKRKKRETKGHFKKDKKTLLSTQKGSQHHQKNEHQKHPQERTTFNA